MKIESDILKTAAVVTILVGVYGGAIYWPSQRQNKALADQTTAKQAELNAMAQPDLAPLREQITALRAELRDRSVELPVGELHDRVLDHVSETLLAQGVTLYETSYGQTQAYKRFSMTPIEVTFEGRFPAAFNIIRQIEHQGPPVRIEKLRLKGDAKQQTNHVDVDLKMSSFFLPEGQQGGGQ